MREKKDIRLFFALWPDDEIRARLQQAVESLPVEAPARRVPFKNLHLTLHFIGNVYFDQMACLQHRARQLAMPGFDLSIDCSGHFSKAKVGWLGCRNLPQALLDFHHALGVALAPCDYQPETRDYNPHITVARKISSLESINIDPVPWSIDRFALVEVHPVPEGVEYRQVESFRLR